MTSIPTLTNEDLENVCYALLLQLTSHLTEPSRASELRIFMLLQRCNEIALLHSSGTILELMADEVMEIKDD